MINNFRPLISDDIAARALVAPLNRLRDEMIYTYLIIDNRGGCWVESDYILLLRGAAEEDGKPLAIYSFAAYRRTAHTWLNGSALVFPFLSLSIHSTEA